MNDKVNLFALPNAPTGAQRQDALDQGLVVRRYQIELDPERAMRDVNAAISEFLRERMRDPDALIVGVETYWSLCRAATSWTQNFHGVLRLNEWRGTRLLVDDEIRWRVRAVTTPDHAHHWRCALEEVEGA